MVACWPGIFTVDAVGIHNAISHPAVWVGYAISVSLLAGLVVANVGSSRWCPLLDAVGYAAGSLLFVLVFCSWLFWWILQTWFSPRFGVLCYRLGFFSSVLSAHPASCLVVRVRWFCAAPHAQASWSPFHLPAAVVALVINVVFFKVIAKGQ